MHILEYFSAWYDPTWMKVKAIMSTEINQTQKDKYCIIQLI